MEEEQVTFRAEEAPANYVPAAALLRGAEARSVLVFREEIVVGLSLLV